MTDIYIPDEEDLSAIRWVGARGLGLAGDAYWTEISSEKGYLYGGAGEHPQTHTTECGFPIRDDVNAATMTVHAMLGRTALLCAARGNVLRASSKATLDRAAFHLKQARDTLSDQIAMGSVDGRRQSELSDLGTMLRKLIRWGADDPDYRPQPSPLCR